MRYSKLPDGRYRVDCPCGWHAEYPSRRKAKESMQHVCSER